MKKLLHILLSLTVFFSIALIFLNILGTYLASPAPKNLSLSGTCIKFDESSITLQIENNTYAIAIGPETQVRVESKFIIPPALKNFQNIDKFPKDLFIGNILQVEAKKIPDSPIPLALSITVIEPFTTSPIENNNLNPTPPSPRHLPSLPPDSAVLKK